VLYLPAAPRAGIGPRCFPKRWSQPDCRDRHCRRSSLAISRLGSDFLANCEIALTFDDGPSASATPGHQGARRALHKATFFMVGSRALAETRLVKEIARTP
jgi:hypothetical protein